jgi:poly(A) polymerase
MSVKDRDFILLGAIDQDGEVMSIKSKDGVHPPAWYRHKRWRYYPDYGILSWWEPPSEQEKEAVMEYLKSNNYNPITSDIFGQKLKEGTTEPFILGAINAWGDVMSKTVRDDDARHPEEWRRYKTWRFIPEIGLLMWWEPPDDGEKLTVEDWLERRGYEINLRSVMGQKKWKDIYTEISESNIKHSLYESWDVVVGSIGMDGQIRSKESGSTHTELGIQRGNPWRYVKYNKTVYWMGDGSEHTQDDEFLVESHLDKKYGYEVNKHVNIEENPDTFQRNWMISHGHVIENLKSLGGSTIKRYKNLVGKRVGNQLYVHKKYANEVIPNDILKKAALILKQKNPTFRFNSIMWDMKTNAIRFDEAPDFDTAREPHVGQYIVVFVDGTTREGSSNSIWHHKWLWVKDDYDGFDVDKAANWSRMWLSKVQGIAKGTDASFGTQLKQVGLKELFMTEDTQDEAALDFLKTMVRKGPFKGKVFLAGGAVRDMVMGSKPKDLDVVVVGAGLNGGIDFTTWLAQKMGNYKEGSNPVTFEKFGTAKVVLTGEHNGVSLDGMDVEAVASRKEEYTQGSRKPEVKPGTLEDDIFRRDLTVNSLIMDLTTDEILDLTGKGKDDIKKGIIRTTSDPDIIFGQDALRMFRAIRFAAKYGWELAPELVAGIKKNLNNLGNTSKERIRDELNKILVTGNPKRGFELLKDTGLLPYVAQEFQQAVGMVQNKHHSQDVFGHTLTVLQNTKPDLVTRITALFHDIGKVATRSETPTGVHFYEHEKVGAEVAEKIMRDLKYPNELIDAVKLGVRNHMRLKSGGDEAKLSDKVLRKFKIELGDNLEKVLDVIHADNISHSDASSMPNQVERVRQRLKALDVQVKKPQLPISGEDLKAMGLKPGPIFSTILNAVTDAWFENPNISREEGLAIAQKMMSNDKT